MHAYLDGSAWSLQTETDDLAAVFCPPESTFYPYLVHTANRNDAREIPL